MWKFINENIMQSSMAMLRLLSTGNLYTIHLSTQYIGPSTVKHLLLNEVVHQHSSWMTTFKQMQVWVTWRRLVVAKLTTSVALEQQIQGPCSRVHSYLVIWKHWSYSTLAISIISINPVPASPPTTISLLPGRTTARQLYRGVGKQLINSQKLVIGLYEKTTPLRKSTHDGHCA